MTPTSLSSPPDPCDVSGRTQLGRTLRRFVAMSTAAMATAIITTLGCDGSTLPETTAPEPILTNRPRFAPAVALELVRSQLDFGPRVPGTPGHTAQANWMADRLRAAADTVVVDSFTVRHSQSGAEIHLVNLLARWNPGATERRLFLAHWDTRPTADAESDPARRSQPIPGANDGGSGTAILLAVAEIMARASPESGVDLLLVDGEDLGPTTVDMFLGAKHYANRLDDFGPRPEWGVLLDMVGDATPRFPVEGYSAQYAPELVQEVWQTARLLGYGPNFPLDVGIPLQDDHLPLNQAGLPTLNIIDFDYGPGNGYWHTLQDDFNRISPSTLDMVGELVLELIYR